MGFRLFLLKVYNFQEVEWNTHLRQQVRSHFGQVVNLFDLQSRDCFQVIPERVFERILKTGGVFFDQPLS